MPATKFTPGPWSVFGDSITIDGADRGPVAHAAFDNRTPEVRRVNTLLIAAAPDLYAALEAIQREPYGCRFCDSGTLRAPETKGHEHDCGFALAAAALARARGES